MTITQKVFFPGVKPVQIYDAYINSKKHSEFTGTKASCDSQEGNSVLGMGTSLVGSWN